MTGNGQPPLQCVLSARLQIIEFLRAPLFGSEFPEQAVGVTFDRFETLAKIQQLSLQVAPIAVVDCDAQVADEPFQLEEIQGKDFDRSAPFARLQGLFDPFEWIAVPEQERSFLGCEWDFNDLSIHQSLLLTSARHSDRDGNRSACDWCNSIASADGPHRV